MFTIYVVLVPVQDIPPCDASPLGFSREPAGFSILPAAHRIGLRQICPCLTVSTTTQAGYAVYRYR
jgi:hypothetical protein